MNRPMIVVCALGIACVWMAGYQDVLCLGGIVTLASVVKFNHRSV